MYKFHTRLNLIEGGNRFKQGDRVSLSFSALDSRGEAIDLENKNIQGEIYSSHKGVIYEKAASYDTAKQLIIFQIDRTLDYGTFQIEFTVTDPSDADYRLKIPSDPSDGRINILGSTDSMDFVGVKMTTVSQLRAEIDTKQQQFEAQVNPKVQQIETEQQRLQADYQAAAANLTQDSEVILARGNEVSLGTRLNKTAAQLAETGNSLASIESANATDDINLVNYLGNKQNIHPKVLYFPNKWNGFKYWMAYTPYPNGNTLHENPCIAVSDDKFNWTVPTGLTNPLDFAPPHGYNSDTHLVYRGDLNSLEIWWREVDLDNSVKRIFRRTSTNGVDWTPEELVFNLTVYHDDMLSPCVIFEEGKYKIWFVTVHGNKRIDYIESVGANIDAWEPRQTIMTHEEWGGLSPWHMDVMKTDIGLEMIVTAHDYAGTNNTSDLYYVLVKPNGEKTKPRLILQRSKNPSAIDHQGIYRSAIHKEDGKYFIFYSSISKEGTRHMSLAYGDSIFGLTGFKDHNRYKKAGNRTATIPAGAVLTNFDVTDIDTLLISGGTEVTINSFTGAYLGKKIDIVGISSTSKARIKNSSRITVPQGIDYIFDSRETNALTFICSDVYGTVFRPIITLPNSTVRFVSLSAAQDLVDFDVTNVDTIMFYNANPTPYTVYSFKGGYVGQKVDLIISGSATTVNLVQDNSKLFLPGRQNLSLTEAKLGMRMIKTSGSVWRVY